MKECGTLSYRVNQVPVKITDRSAQFSQQSASVRSDSNSRDEQSTQSQASDISDSDTTPVPSPKRSASRSSRQRCLFGFGDVRKIWIVFTDC